MRSVGGPGDVLETVEYGYFDEEVFDLLRDPSSAATIASYIHSLLHGRAGDGGAPALHEEPADYPQPSSSTALFPHEAEALREMQAGLKPPTTVISNVHLYDPHSKQYLECDAIVVAPFGILVVELKHWSGTIRVAPYSWTIDENRSRRDPHIGNGFKCRVLKGIYEHQFPTYPDIWVESVVVLTNPEATVEGADSPVRSAEEGRHNPTFASMRDFLSYMRKRDGESGARVLTDAQVQAIASFIRSKVTPSRSQGYSLPGFEIVEYQVQTPERIEMLARRTIGSAKGLCRVRVFRPPRGGILEERQRAVRKALATQEAVGRIGDHPNLLKVQVWASEDGDLIEVSDWSESGTLRELIAARREPLPLDEALDICRGLAEALAEAHRVGIYHRAIKPEHILMMNGIPKLADFDLSYDLQRTPGDITVIPDPSELADDGYTPPELLRGETVGEGTDLFSLGVIAYQLLTGEKPFARARRFEALGGQLAQHQIELLRRRQVPDAAIQAIADAVVADPRSRLADATVMATAFGSRSSAGASDINRILSPGEKYDVYEIVELVGTGRESQVYRASTAEQEQVALKLFHREVPRERIFRQIRHASSVSSNHIVRHHSLPGHWNNGDRYFAVMEYVEGGTLRKRIETGERADPASLERVASGLMEALEAMHGRTSDGHPDPLVHGDIKPENVLLTSDGQPKLTDFSVAGSPRIDTFQGTPGYVPPDLMDETDMTFDPRGDLFALGVTLWEYAFGERPYISPALGSKPKPPASSRLPDAMVSWLERAVSTSAGERFDSVAEMKKAFLMALAESRQEESEGPAGADGSPAHGPAGEPGQPGQSETGTGASRGHAETQSAVGLRGLAANPFVRYLNSLSNATPANDGAIAESQQASPFFPSIRVENPITDTICRWLLEEGRNVILTGNAGDGKTTIAGEIHRRLTDSPLPPEPRVEVRSHGIVIFKDMSELAGETRARLLEEAFQRGRGYLIVSNTGALLKSAGAARLEGIPDYKVEDEILHALQSDEALDVLGGRFRLLNLGRTDSIETALGILQRILHAPEWGECEACKLQADCPILENLRLVREAGETLLRRVELLYRRMYEYGVRLTLREMTGHLAYALTGGNDCDQLAGMSATALAARSSSRLFFNRFFGDDGREAAVEAGQMETVRRLRAAGIGQELEPAVERLLWTDDQSLLPLTGEALLVYRRLRGSEHAVPDAAIRRQIRRLIYFFGDFETIGAKDLQERFLTTFLGSPKLLDYLEVVRPNGRAIDGLKEARWRYQILQVLQEYFAGIRLPEGSWKKNDTLYITLNRRTPRSRTQMVLAEFQTNDFRVATRPRHTSLPNAGRLLVLEKLENGVRLDLDLPFLDYVDRRHQGEVSSQLSAHYADRLERFQAKLIAASAGSRPAEDSLKLLSLGAGGRLRLVELRLADSGYLEVV